jgi:hypothetical protein
MTLTPPLQKVARPIVDDFRQDMKAGPDAAKLAYNNIVGFLQDPHGLPQMDLVISYIRLAGGGRLNQAQIDQDLKSGTSAGGMLRKWTNIYLKGDVIGPEQMEQIRNSSYHLYQQTLAQEYQLRQNAIRQLQANGVPAAILPEGTRVIDPQTNKPIEWEGAPDTPAQGAPPAGEDWSGPTPSGPAASPAAPATRMTKPPTAAPDDWAEAIQRGLVK